MFTTLKPKKQLKKLELRGTVIGMLLGDGYVEVKKTSPRGRFVIKHSRKQGEYCKYKMERLSELVKVEYTISEGQYLDARTNKIYQHTVGKTRTHRYFKKIRDLIYPNGTKKITRNILDYLTPEGLSYWYMDDGYLMIQKRGKGGCSRWSAFSTNSFSYEEHLIIKDYFKERWNIVVRINKAGKFKKTGKPMYIITINSTETKKLFEIISPFIHEDLKYKIDMKYDTVPERN